MKVYCTHCGKYLGEIRDATLRKNIYYICEYCRIEFKPTGFKYYDFFKEIFPEYKC